MKTTIPTINASIIKRLNDRYIDLFSRKTVILGDTAYWANTTTKGIYAESADAYRAGVINGYKVARINELWNIEPISAFADDEE